MPRYIDADKLLARYKEQCEGCKATQDYCEHCCLTADVISDIEDAPTADVVEVKHGEWKHLGGDEWCCSRCGFVITTEGSWEHPRERGNDFCKHCGAKMDGGKGNDCL